MSIGEKGGNSNEQDAWKILNFLAEYTAFYKHAMPIPLPADKAKNASCERY